MRMKISIILQLNFAVIIFLFLLFPSDTNSINILPEFVTFFINQIFFTIDPLEEGRANKILNFHYRRYLFSKDLQEIEKLKISFTSNIYLFYKIENKIKGPKKHLIVLNYIYNTNFELGLCKMLEYRQKLKDLFVVEGEKSSKKGERPEKSSKKGERLVVDCSEGQMKNQLKDLEDWIQEANFAMFLHFFYITQKLEFNKMLRNFMNKAKEKEIGELRKRFVELFGLARMVQLALIYPNVFGEMMNTNGNGQKKIMADLIQEYLEIKRPNNVIKKWTIRYVLNYFLYRDWWQKYNEEKFNDKKSNPAKLWEKALNEYWAGENVLRWEMKMRLAKMNGKGLEVEEGEKAEVLFQDIKDNFLDTKSFAKDQLLDKGSFLEGVKEMTEKGIQERRCQKFKLKKKMNEKEMEQFWLKCLNENLKYVDENLMGQKEMYTEGMMNLMKERAGKGEFEFIWQSPTKYRDENFKDLFNYEKNEFLRKYTIKINNLDEKNVRIADKGKEISSSIGNSIYPKEKEKEIENEVKDEIIEENEEAKTNEIEGKKEMEEEKGEIIEKPKKKDVEISKGKSTVDVKQKPKASIEKKIEQLLKEKEQQKEKPKMKEIEKKKEKKETEKKKEIKNIEEEVETQAKLKSGYEKYKVNLNEMGELEKKYGVVMKKKTGGGKTEKEKLEEKIEEKEKSLDFCEQIEQFYKNFIAEKNEEKLIELIEFMNICILVKIIEQNFKAFLMMIKQGIPNGDGLSESLGQNLKKWKKFKEKNLKNQKEKMERKLVEKIFKKWKKYSKRGGENVKEEDMEEILGKMHFSQLALMIGKAEAETKEIEEKMGDEEFEKNSPKNEDKMGEQFYKRLGRIMPKMMIGGNNGWEKFGQKFVNQIKVKMGMVNQQKFEKNIKEEFMELTENNNQYRMEPAKWMDPHFYEISSAENWPKINLENSKILEEYLDKIYAIDLKAEVKENAKKWLRHQMEKWLANINRGKVDYTMVIIGSTLIGTAMPNSDLDILFLVPKFGQNLYEQYLPSFFKHLREAIKNEAELNKFGLKQQHGWLRLIEPNSWVPAHIKLQIDFVNLDILMAQISMEKIPQADKNFNLKKLQLENAEKEENIRPNTFILDFLIENILNENEVGRHQKGSIYALASYRSTYRQKFVMIEKSGREIFTQLLRAVKYWAKRQHIYSNQFGYLSGTSLTLMATKICILYPTGDLPFLLEKFFFIYATWPWPKPLLLEELTPKEIVEKYKIKMEYWEPTRIEKDGEMMPIITAMFPEGNSAFNVNEMGRKVIKSKMVKAYQMIIENEENGGRNSDFWKEQFFGEFDYGKYFEDFLLIICSDKKLNNSTCGWSKNKICDALLNWNNDKAELKNVLEEYQIMSDFERKGECVKKDGHECVGWIVGFKFFKESKANLNDNQKLKFWQDLSDIFTKDYKYVRKTHEMEIFHLTSAELKENISSFILEKKDDEMDKIK